MVNFLLDLLFPQQACSLCREPGRYGTHHPWCQKCQQNMIELKTNLPICDKCGKYLENDGTVCADCGNNPPSFHIARAVGPYEETYRLAIKVFKFMCKKYMGATMGHMMADVVKKEPRFWPLDMIIPVPISEGHYKQRGFNQTEVLGIQIGKEIKINMETHILKRVKETPSQRELSRQEREKNLLCAFAVQEPEKIYRKNILLVDDVFTTGSTSRECTRVLLEAGAEKVAVITWATGKGF